LIVELTNVRTANEYACHLISPVLTFFTSFSFKKKNFDSSFKSVNNHALHATKRKQKKNSRKAKHNIQSWLIGFVTNISFGVKIPTELAHRFRDKYFFR
jgi:hypothetical protein